MHDAILETILCGMNEVNSSNIKQEIKKLSEVQAGGMTGFQEKFKVSIPVDMLCCFYQYLHCILWTKHRTSFFFYILFYFSDLPIFLRNFPTRSALPVSWKKMEQRTVRKAFIQVKQKYPKNNILQRSVTSYNVV